jgi:hypothetical protein
MRRSHYAFVLTYIVQETHSRGNSVFCLCKCRNGSSLFIVSEDDNISFQCQDSIAASDNLRFFKGRQIAVGYVEVLNVHDIRVDVLYQ